MLKWYARIDHDHRGLHSEPNQFLCTSGADRTERSAQIADPEYIHARLHGVGSRTSLQRVSSDSLHEIANPSIGDCTKNVDTAIESLDVHSLGSGISPLSGIPSIPSSPLSRVTRGVPSQPRARVATTFDSRGHGGVHNAIGVSTASPRSGGKPQSPWRAHGHGESGNGRDRRIVRRRGGAHFATETYIAV